jgi:DNA-binding transcriptional regulator YhcF (GntR family)
MTSGLFLVSSSDNYGEDVFIVMERDHMAPLVHIRQHLNETSNLPLYQRLQRALRSAIEQHLLKPEDALPAERQLAADLEISRITVRKAIDGLVGEGVLVRRPGSGNFINTRIEKNFAKLTSFSEDMRARGRTPRSVWLKRSEGTVTPDEAMRLRLSPGAAVYRFNRMRYADDVPMCLEYATIVASCRRWTRWTCPCTTRWKRPATVRCVPCSASPRCCSMPSRPCCCRRRRAMPAFPSSGWVFCAMAARWSFAAPTFAAICMTLWLN